ncbi:hypothetical protein FH972_024495 [Carpinus fangiana]|uniref:Uncharacterized protein n=1 Tax=Carpinus fangiana TaxID=176857 RepID=A0A5N6KYH9_9ROSI|nr:hypothetical protein FH972_024495 [Carpinus fangiana]
MDPWSLSATIKAAARNRPQRGPLVVLERVASLLTLGTPEVEGYAIERFGHKLGTVILLVTFVDVGALQEMHLNINAWTDKQTLAWRSSMLATYNAISVAGAIFATIGVTALQLQLLSEGHWIARAFLATSVPIGTFSLLTSTSLQQKISSLNSALSIRLWLSRGRPNATSKYSSILQDLPLEASLTSIQLIQLPGQLLAIAGSLFVIGFGLSLLFAWLGQVQNASDDRNVFIFFIVVVAFTALNILLLLGMRAISQSRTTRHYSSSNWPDLWKPKEESLFSSLWDDKKMKEQLGLPNDSDGTALHNHLSLTLDTVQKLLTKQSEARTESEVRQVIQKYRSMLQKCMFGMRSGVDSRFMTEFLMDLTSDAEGERVAEGLQDIRRRLLNQLIGLGGTQHESIVQRVVHTLKMGESLKATSMPALRNTRHLSLVLDAMLREGPADELLEQLERVLVELEKIFQEAEIEAVPKRETGLIRTTAVE